MSKAWNCQRQTHRHPAADTPVPPGADYDLWGGPAAFDGTFSPNRYNRNWYHAFGNGDIGGDGPHDLDLARWGLGVTVHPNRITAHGSRIDLEGEREFPDNMMVAYHYDEGKGLIYEDRGWTPYGLYGFDSGNAFYGSDGYMIFSMRRYFQVYRGKEERKGPGMAHGPTGHPDHMYNFVDCVKSREQPVANAEVAHLSCGLIHLGEITYRAGRVPHFDPLAEKFLDDPGVDRLLTKDYREPWTMPDPV